MRQGIVVTFLLGIFVAVAMLFTGGKSLFEMPDAPIVVAEATAIAESVAAPVVAAAPRSQPIAGRDAASGAARNTFGVLEWLSAGFGQLDLGKEDKAQPAFTLAARPTRAPIGKTAEPTVWFGGRHSAAVDTGDGLAGIVQSDGVAASAPQKVAYMPDPRAPVGLSATSAAADDPSAADAAEFERFRVAAEAGDLDAKYRLGVMYRDGRGVARDPAAAANWLLASAKGRNPLAELAVGELYDNGTGVARDPAAAYAWLDLAASHARDQSDRDFAVRERDRVGAGLSHDQLEAARRLADTWKAVKVAETAVSDR
jgi:TPR repeat protein